MLYKALRKTGISDFLNLGTFHPESLNSGLPCGEGLHLLGSSNGIYMGQVVRFKKPKLSDKHRGKKMCRQGYHKWKICQKQKFDVKEGKLVTVYRCERCEKEKIETH